MAFDGTLKFDTAIDRAGFQTGLSGLGDLAKSGLSGIGDIARAGMAAVTGAVKTAADAVLTLGKQAVSAGTDFESGMAQVIATMGITRDTIQDGVNSYDLLSQAAKDAGASTTFSATEAAGALNYLALAGYDAATAADSLDAVLNLAAAGGLDLQYAADLATDAMAALSIEASKENLTHFGDQMAVTASKANTSVAQLGEAILTVGGTAKSLSGGVSEMNAALGVLANRGIKGAEGGTALRNMILSLTAPTDKAAAKLEELGVKVLDDAGNMRSLNDVFGDLGRALSGVSDGEKTQILNDIFNKVDLKSAQAMLAGCGQEFRSLESAVSDCDGAMAQMAETMNDTLEGDMKSLQSRAEALGIAVYESISEPLRDLAQTGAGYLSELKDAFDAGGFAGAAQAVGGILGDAVTVLGGYLPDMAGIGSSVVSSLLDGIRANSGTLIQQGLDMGLTMLQGTGDITERFLELGGDLLAGLADGISGKELRIRRVLREVLRGVLETVEEQMPVMLGAGSEIMEILGGALLENLPLLLEIGTDILQMLTEGITDPDAVALLVGAAVQIVTILGGSLTENLPLLLGAAVQVIVSLVEALSAPDNLNALLDTGLLLLLTLLSAVTDHFETVLAAAITVIEVLGTYLAEHADELIGTGLELLLKILDGIFEHTDEIFLAAETIINALYDELCNEETMNRIFDIGTKLLIRLLDGLIEFTGEALAFGGKLMVNIQQHLMSLDWKQIGRDIIKSIVEGMTDLDLGMLNDFRDDWISGMKTIFGIHSPSALMRDEIGKNLALGVEVGFDANVPDFGKMAEDALAGVPENAGTIRAGIVFDVEDVPEMPEPETPEGVTVPVVYETPDEPEGVVIPVEYAEPEPVETDEPEGVAVPVAYEVPDVPVFASPSPVTVPVEYDAGEVPEPVGISDRLDVALAAVWEMPEEPVPDDITVSLADDAVRILEELRAARVQVVSDVDPEVLEALRVSPVPDASALVPQSVTSVVNNSYQYNSSTSNVSTSSVSAVQEQAASRGGDIVTNVYIGEEKLETVVMNVLELVNARSGGGTI